MTNITNHCLRQLDAVDEFIRTQVTSAAVAEFYKSDMRAAGSLTGCTPFPPISLPGNYTGKKRGDEAMYAAGVLFEFHNLVAENFREL